MFFDQHHPIASEIEWYFCQPGAKVFPFPHRFASINYEDGLYDTVDNSLGEDPFAKGGYLLGAANPWEDGQHYCGHPEAFVNGVDLVQGIPVKPAGHLLDPCCPILPLVPWVVTTTGGATITINEPLHIRIEWEDSANCGGLNEAVQTASAEYEVAFDEESQACLSLEGRIETADPGFDRIAVFINDEEVYSHESTQQTSDCGMEEFLDKVTLDFPVGVSTIRVKFDSVDGNYHVDGFWDLQFDFSGACS